MLVDIRVDGTFNRGRDWFRKEKKKRCSELTNGNVKHYYYTDIIQKRTISLQQLQTKCFKKEKQKYKTTFPFLKCCVKAGTITRCVCLCACAHVWWCPAGGAAMCERAELRIAARCVCEDRNRVDSGAQHHHQRAYGLTTAPTGQSWNAVHTAVLQRVCVSVCLGTWFYNLGPNFPTRIGMGHLAGLLDFCQKKCSFYLESQKIFFANWSYC